MALTYEQTAALMVDVAFKDRTKIACMTYGAYILGEPANVTAHMTRVRWAQQTMLTPDHAAQTVMPTLVMEPEVQANGATISDADLQIATENAVNKIM